ncbi:hypothetical protein QYF36_019741 [Acer negundo]|nr:hypothetical protein QYF36_019741 [Acer negundo]
MIRSAIEVEDVEREEDVLVQRSHWVSRISAAAETQMPMKMTAEINAMARLWMTRIESSGSGGFDGERHVIVLGLIGLLHWFDWLVVDGITPEISGLYEMLNLFSSVTLFRLAGNVPKKLL